MLERKTKIKKMGASQMIYIPRLLASDSAYPFKIEDKVIVKIKGNKLIIEKCEEDGEENGRQN